jgi:hypothetical protein
LTVLGHGVSDWDSSYLRSRVLRFSRDDVRVGLFAGDVAGLFLPRSEEAQKVSGALSTLRLLPQGPGTILSVTDEESSISQPLDAGSIR